MSHTSCPPTGTASLAVNDPRQTVHLLQLMDLHPYIIPQSEQFTLGFIPGVVHSMGLEKYITICTHHDNIQSIFTAVNNLYASAIYPECLAGTTGLAKHAFAFYCLRLEAQEAGRIPHVLGRMDTS